MNVDNPNLPNMSEVVNSWSSPIICYLIKQEIKNYQTVETRTLMKINGMVQNDNDTQNDMKSSGSRTWKRYKLHTTTDVLNIDDIVEIRGIRYRIESKSQDQLHYGFTRYKMIEDYTGDTEV